MFENRIKHLDEAHKALDKRIHGLEATGLYSDDQLHDLKKQKLHIMLETILYLLGSRVLQQIQIVILMLVLYMLLKLWQMKLQHF